MSDNRNSYVSRVVMESLGCTPAVAEDAVQRFGHLIGEFFESGGPSKVVFTWQPEEGSAADVMKVHKEVPEVTKKGCYFIRTSGKKAVDAKAPENDICHGDIAPDGLAGLCTTVSHLYGPLFEQFGIENARMWGKLPANHAKEFVGNVKKFGTGLQKALLGLNSGVVLRKPDADLIANIDLTQHGSLNAAIQDENLIKEFDLVLGAWCDEVALRLAPDDGGMTSLHGDEGPLTEIENWRNQQATFNGIIQQLKTRECKIVTSVANAAKMPKIKKWRILDNQVTDAANEARDNVKYLSALEKYLEPLYVGDTRAVIDGLPGLLNNIKMMHTIARYYNTTEHMTTLFCKITNQCITNCKEQIKKNGKVWDQDINTLLTQLRLCLQLNEAYQEHYRITKEKLLTQPKGKQFDFSENQIFGKFELFCKRIQKLVDMFSTVDQFQTLAEHKIEGMDELINNFFNIVDEFKKKPYEILDFNKNQFDRDYLEFNVSIHELETALQGFINASFESIMSTTHALTMLKQFQAILSRDNLKADLESKYMVIFHNYGLDLETVQKMYEKGKNGPPLSRNAPPVAGNIQWCRQLLRRIETPMKQFQQIKHILTTKESKKIIKTYNKVARALIEFETLWHYAWSKSVDTAKAGLNATLLVRHPENDKLYVNFDREILKLIRESKCLHRLGIEVPDSANMVLLQEEKFKQYYAQLSYALKQYDSLIARVLPVTKHLLRRHSDDLESKIQPGMDGNLTWTSMNIDAYLARLHKGLAKFSELLDAINGIVEHRVEAVLREVSKTLLIDLPEDETVSLDVFVARQDKFVRSKQEWMDQKNYAVENAVHDLIQHVRTYEFDDSSSHLDEGHATNLSDHYSRLMYRAILACTKNSLKVLKKRVGSTSSGGFLFVERPFFDVDVELSIPNVAMNPSLDDVQAAVNHTALHILKCSKKLYSWGTDRDRLKAMVEAGGDWDGEMPTTYFDNIGCDPEIVKMVLLLTGAVEGTKKQVFDYMETFHQYDWLWKNDMNAEYAVFMKTNPTIDAFETKLKWYMSVEQEIMKITPVHNIGALSLETAPLKYSLKAAAAGWKTRYATNLHSKAKESLEHLVDYIADVQRKLRHKIADLEDVRLIMDTLKEVRDREAEIDLQFGPVEQMYALLTKYEVRLPKEELDIQEGLRYSWKKLRTQATKVSDQLANMQAGFKKDLTKKVRVFVADVVTFRSDFVTNGPMVPGIKPMEAVERLTNFENQFATAKRKWDTYAGGEVLFGLPKTEYKDLEKTESELKFLKRLYNLYVEVIDTISGYNEILWVDVVANIDTMTEEVSGFAAKMKKLPKALRDWDAYAELKKTIEDFLEVLPLLQMLSNDAMRPRHWKEIQETCGVELKMDPETFKLVDLMQCDLNKFADEVEDVAGGSGKELQIEVKLAEVVGTWEDLAFEFNNYKKRGPVLLKGVPDILEMMEDTQMVLGSMMSSRYITPFKDDVGEWVHKMSTVAEIIEQWVVVQNYWTYMEAVFSSGDIAKQLPQEAKRFATIDKGYMKIMDKAFTQPLVVPCCCNDALKQMLPYLNEQLELCQKSLTGYLEAKRNIFARFYFVSDPVLLEILSQGSNPEAIQAHLPAVLDSVYGMIFDKKDKNRVVRLRSGEGESIPVAEHVNCQATGNVEDWLGAVVWAMRMSIKELTRNAASDYKVLSLEDFIIKYPAQLSLLGIQFLWTDDSEDSLLRAKTEKGVMNQSLKKQVGIMNEMINMSLRDWSKMDRKKLETMITIQAHQRDESQEFVKNKVRNTEDFAWQKQARFYWRPEVEDETPGDGGCVVSVADVDLAYCYEYCGVKERLVITSLTDRCYITLSQALGMYLGGAPAGPAGTGKTETVKDLGRTLALWVVVTNCSDQMDYLACAKIFKGISMSGAWGCFDEFNRIDLEVLSVVASQVACVNDAKREQKSEFVFIDGQKLILDAKCGYYITMNPGYAGRQELPENLKSLFRGVAMMVPNRQTIMTVKLAACGYQTNISLGKKFFVLYALCEQQLSKQTHYDFGLRNIISVLRTCGSTKRAEPDKSEPMLFMRTVRDMNLSKFVADDVPLFLSLIADIFPGLKAEKARYANVEAAIANQVKLAGLQMHPDWVDKVVQLYETYLVRHGIMVVGAAGCGKSSIWTTLATALTELAPTGEGAITKELRMNPKAITAPQMFGRLDAATGDWTDGIFSKLWRDACKAKDKDIWLIADGPVDAIWIENLNTVLDDNRLLTLANGDRIMMGATMKMCFEPENLLNASPATVSRAGIIYVSDTVLDWYPPVMTWLDGRRPAEAEVFKKFFEEYGQKSLDFVRVNCTVVMSVVRVSQVASLCLLLESMLKQAVEDNDAVEETILERYFMYALCWTVGGMLELADRIQFDEHCRGMSEACPMREEGSTDLLYEYFIDDETGDWKHWNLMIPNFDYDPKMEFAQAFVPTLDSTRYQYIMSLAYRLKNPFLVCGDGGTTKTATIMNYVNQALAREPDNFLSKMINFSFRTSHNLFQLTIEGVVEKRTGRNYGPSGGKKMFVFIDDISMPEVNNWGDQPTNEIVRQLLTSGGMYVLEPAKDIGKVNFMTDLLYYAAMSHPGGGKNDLPTRLTRCFISVNMTLPAKASIDNVFGSILRGRFTEDIFDEATVSLAHKLTETTIIFWEKIKAKMLPTPAKFHYIFNMRDLSRVFQGVMLAPNEVINSAETLCKLWKHECERVFQDKLTTSEDKEWVDRALSALVKDAFGEDYAAMLDGKQYFVDFQREPTFDDEGVCIDEHPKVYEPVPTMLSVQKLVYTKMKDFNENSKILKLDLVLFDDAMEHLMRISRILGMPRGSALLVGVGGSGKQSLTRLASFVAGNFTFQIVITKSYNTNNLFDDLKVLYRKAGVGGEGVSFIFTDAEVKEEGFLEFINNLLSTGEIPGMFPKDEIEAIVGDMRPVAKKHAPKGFIDTGDNLYKYFVDRVRDNLHVVLCFSPIGEKFRNRALMFPGLFACCSIDWFLPWPQEALASVASKYLGRFEISATEPVKKAIIQHCAFVHIRVTSACDEYMEKFRRQVYVTPKSYLTFIEEYQRVYKDKYETYNTQRSNLKVGLDKLLEAGEDVTKMKEDLKIKEKTLEEAQRVSKALLVDIQASTAKAEKKKNECAKVAESAGAESAAAGKIKAVVEEDLKAAKPALDSAMSALDAIYQKDINNLKALGNPPLIIQVIMDTVLVLFQAPLDKVTPVDYKGIDLVPQPTYHVAKLLMTTTPFLENLKGFAKEEINDETVELLSPYLEYEWFTVENAAKASGSLAGLCAWCSGMSVYQRVAKDVGPKMIALKAAEKAKAIADKGLAKAMGELAETQAELDKMQAQYEGAMKEKKRLEDDKDATKRKMDAANSLINGLSGEKVRWTNDLENFADTISRLVGDVALACAFVSYCGPFNQEFRLLLLNTYFYGDCTENGIPVTKDLDVVPFLTDESEMGEWNLEGLPSDNLSIQNGILVTRSSRWPLLIDPQGQAHNWISQREGVNGLKTVQLAERSFRNSLEECMGYGKPLLIENVEEEIDPVLDPVFLKQIIPKGKGNFIIQLSDKECDYNEMFTLALTTKLPNPHFTPELSAKVTIIDFTVTMGGLEDQLLGVVISKEKPELEEQRAKLLAEVNGNKKTMKQLEENLLDRLSNATGNLLDDVELIQVLANTKKTATEVAENLHNAAETEARIMETREEYRPVAIQGSVLYFLVTGMTLVNSMYNTSLAQFMELFLISIAKAPKAPLASKRIKNVIDVMTFTVYAYIQRGLFEAHKVMFAFLMAMKIAIRGGPGIVPGVPAADAWLTQPEFDCVLKGGAALDIGDVRKKPFDWIPDLVWCHVIAACDMPGLGDFADSMYRSEQMWRKWFELEAPELEPIPDFHDRCNPFQRCLITRLLRPDRTLLAVRQYIRDELGERYAESIPVDFDVAHAETVESGHGARTPLVCLLSSGADPTDLINGLAKKNKKKTSAVSMGQGQEIKARALIAAAVVSGDWVVLQNCHLGLGYLFELEQTLVKLEEVNEEFRVFITCEPSKRFPIGLLQMSIKITNEAPVGIRAGLKRSYTWVNQDLLDTISRPEWRQVVFVMCFCHSILQERRKFGSIGWAIPYEYNQGDLSACTMFLQNHMGLMESKAGKNAAVQLQWGTVNYMIAECQYGGRVTDDLDRVLMSTYANFYFNQKVLEPGFTVFPGYSVPTGAGSQEIDFWRAAIPKLPDNDTPELFGMHVNADITFRNKQTNELLTTIIDTQPKAAGGGGGLSVEDVACNMADDLLSKLPPSFDPNVVIELLGKQGGRSKPLNVCLFQEIERLDKIIQIVRVTLLNLKLAIAGTIILGEDLIQCMNALYDARAPGFWEKKSWECPTIGLWFASFLKRFEQLDDWMRKGRPNAYWLTGFFNPAGMITATLQEVCRKHNGWALDDVVKYTEVTKNDNSDLRSGPEEGAYIYGLWIDGAGWDRKRICLCDQAPKQLFYELPVVMITGQLESEKKFGWGFGSDGKKVDTSLYSAPLYMYPRRLTGALGTYIGQFELNCGGESPEKWCLRGVCLLTVKD